MFQDTFFVRYWHYAAIFGALFPLGCHADTESLALTETADPVNLSEQMAPVPFRVQPHAVSASPMSAVDAESVAPFHEEIRVPGAMWLQVRFGNYELGSKSYVTIRGLKDNAEQRLTAKTMSQAYGLSAIFNGEAVDVDLHIGEGDTGVFIEIQEVNVGETPIFEESQCGGTDDRVRTTDNRVGRIMPVGCTGWIIDAFQQSAQP